MKAGLVPLLFIGHGGFGSSVEVRVEESPVETGEK